jgi:hypothetical protein
MKSENLYRNYNIGRDVDENTTQFEVELNNLLSKYSNSFIETQTFKVDENGNLSEY